MKSIHTSQKSNIKQQLKKLVEYHTVNDAMYVHNCDFCNYKENIHEIFLETPNFYLCPTCSPLVEGHIMVISKHHFGAAGEFSGVLQDELLTIMDVARDLSCELYNKVIAYEHGRAGHCVQLKGTGIACHHFHLHFLPAPVDIREFLKNKYREVILDEFSNIFNAHERYGNYLFFENTQGNKYFYCVDDKTVESHLISTLLCEQLKTPERASWEEYKNPALSKTTYEKFKSLLEKYIL